MSKFAPAPAVELPEVEEEPDLSDATPLQVLEHIAVNGKSETARVQALKVLVDRQSQLERERAEHREPRECSECAKRAARTPYDDPEQAARVIAELAALGAIPAALGVEQRRERPEPYAPPVELLPPEDVEAPAPAESVEELPELPVRRDAPPGLDPKDLWPAGRRLLSS